MTFKTKFKIGDMVVIEGLSYRIDEVHLEVGAEFKKVLYRYYSNLSTKMVDISEEELLKGNPIGKNSLNERI